MPLYFSSSKNQLFNIYCSFLFVWNDLTLAGWLLYDCQRYGWVWYWRKCSCWNASKPEEFLSNSIMWKNVNKTERKHISCEEVWSCFLNQFVLPIVVHGLTFVAICHLLYKNATWILLMKVSYESWHHSSDW